MSLSSVTTDTIMTTESVPALITSGHHVHHGGHTHQQLTTMAFKAICEFVHDLAEMYGKDPGMEPLEHYDQCLQSIVCPFEIQSHLDLFREYLQKVEHVLLAYHTTVPTCDPVAVHDSKSWIHDVAVSDLICLRLDKIMTELASHVDKHTIIKHLLLIMTFLFPDHPTAKHALKMQCAHDTIPHSSECTNHHEMCASKKKKTGTGFIMELVDEIDSTIGHEFKNMDPQNLDIGSVINTFISSGAMNKIFSGLHDVMTSGDIDIADLLKATQNFIPKK